LARRNSAVIGEEADSIVKDRQFKAASVQRRRETRCQTRAAPALSTVQSMVDSRLPLALATQRFREFEIAGRVARRCS